ncbi:hypothetical protein [Vacuolonema iberomarrocanum]|uniref:hypothetical protein n=1 Tax=Vacuolonema iberomarrocanum TaxID=3454632 RepID=UPI0019E64E32|nr:hypothetical protein [filamentous cyanobacterium LEGE 07170]
MKWLDHTQALRLHLRSKVFLLIITLEHGMGTELNYFHIVNGEEFRSADKRPSPPRSFHEICNGYDHFKQFIDTACRHKNQIYYSAYGEFIIDSDNKILLFYISYTELAYDFIKTAATLVKKVQLAWPEWSVRWACGGRDETRFYLECLKDERASHIINSYKCKDNLFEILKQVANQQTGGNANYTGQPCDLDALRTQFFDAIALCQEKYGDDWELLIDLELYDEIRFSVKTTLLYISKSKRYKYLHFVDNMSDLLSCENLLTYCRNSETYMESDYFPEELRWCLSCDVYGGSMVIDEETQKLVVVPPPTTNLFRDCVNALIRAQWCDCWDISFDLPILYAYHLRAKERS